jgi:hypothetical protein
LGQTLSQSNFDMLMHFINERHRIFLKREAGEPAPWTNDPILQEWKFCNPFRENDRQTRNLRKILQEHYPAYPPDMLFNIFLFRAFNLDSTYNLIGWRSSAAPFYVETAIRTLQEAAASGTRIFSAAYMIRGRQGMPKISSVCLTLQEVWDKRHEIYAEISTQSARSLEKTWKILMEQGFWGWGPFTLYQIVLDLAGTSTLSHAIDTNSWTCLGPGGERGFKLLFPDINPALWQTFLPKNLLPKVNAAKGRHVPLLNLQDLEFCLCELQKYHRIANGGKSKERYHGRT